MELDQTKISSLEYFLICYARRTKYFRILISTRCKEIQEDSQTQWFKRQPFPKEIQGEWGQDLANVSMCHTQTQTGQIHLWKFPDRYGKSLMKSQIPWQFPDFFVKMREFFKFPDNSLILLIAVNPDYAVTKIRNDRKCAEINTTHKEVTKTPIFNDITKDRLQDRIDKLL